MLDGVLFFPVTPFDDNGDVDLPALEQHIESGVAAGPGGVFAACGTGEFHALSAAEFRTVVETVVTATGGRVPVFAGAGGALPVAKEFVAAAADAGADGILLLPPYLVGAPADGLVEYVRQVSESSDLPVIVYHRANGQFTEQSALAVARLPKVVGFKDGVGDLDLTSRIVRTLRDSLGDKEFQFFNGLPTAEVSQQAYRSIGVTLYSSATFAFAPDVSLAYYRALEEDDTELVDSLNREFFHPLVRLRDTTPGYAVALVKAGVTFTGLDAGSVRAPLVDASAEHRYTLEQILAAGRKVLAQ
ncbi:5-dehydro-4-deoxyglucarate dehydratase [Rhodococcus wratislaviensis]|uniref:Probable 5-dehydro-4-deoxyglucarate dehydratase n=1 Tax=Rhodococcus wratislaviensis TaxID=44752 RepID=A0A402BYC4_RHOWR|nr:5-dehydro-4-deoxyglucarate dehydratase [Rhodococcus wratislaviensis]GCE36378.1 5-dehydro-4-deoxyglucarate dehydratase [Rhodococcus wratislaviensis]